MNHRVRIAPEPPESSLGDPRHEANRLTPLHLDSVEESEQDDGFIDRLPGETESQFQLWDSISPEAMKSGVYPSRFSAARHPGWATFDKDNLANMDCFGGILTRTLKPCPKVAPLRRA